MPGAPVPQPCVLEGAHVRLEPLSLLHLDGLCDVGFDDDIWRWMLSQVRSRDDMRAWIEAALQARDEGSALPFATVEKASGQVVGSTRFGSIDPAHRRVEIGWTWIARPWQRTVVNTEAKLLMLRHAFDVLHCVRVELKTDALNTRSRHAILMLGAVEEGTLRRHMRTATGRMRDTVYFSILDDEWPHAREALESRLNQTMGRSPWE